MSERVAYLDGEMVPESDMKISVFDTGFMYGATVYESVRTFKHRLLHLDEHMARLDASLRYVGLDASVTAGEVGGILERVLCANIHLTHSDDDVWLCAGVTPGGGFPHPQVPRGDRSATVIAYSAALPHGEYARFYTEGKRAVTVSIRNIPAEVIAGNAKHRSRLHLFLAAREAREKDPDAFALLLDTSGNLSESTGANFFIVKDGTLLTPTTRNIVIGISRQAVIALAGDMGIPVCEMDLKPGELRRADEAFFTTSSYCMLPVSYVDGRRMGEVIPGPVTGRLLEAWSGMAGVDIVKQAQRFAGPEG